MLISKFLEIFDHRRSLDFPRVITHAGSGRKRLELRRVPKRLVIPRPEKQPKHKQAGKGETKKHRSAEPTSQQIMVSFVRDSLPNPIIARPQAWQTPAIRPRLTA